MEKTSPIQIPTSLVEKIKKRIEGTNFKTPADYITYVLREILAKAEEEEPFTHDDEEKIKQRLRALGYLD